MLKHNPTSFCTSLCVCAGLIALLLSSSLTQATNEDYSGFGSGEVPSTAEPTDTEPDDSINPSSTSPSTSSPYTVMPSPSPNAGATSVIEGCEKPAGAGPGVALVSEREMELKARCYVACLDELLTREDREYEELLQTRGPGWLSVPTSFLRQHCSLYQKLQECTQGCTSSLASEHNVQKSCNASCYGSCRDYTTVISPYLPESRCPRVCSMADCETGCYVHSELPSNGSKEGVPPLSLSGNLTIDNYHTNYLHLPALFSLSFDAADHIVGQNETSTSPDLIAFIVHVSDVELESDTYFMLESLQDPLELDAGSICHRVKVAIAPVNKYGRALSYSEPVLLEVFADPYPGVADNPNPFEVRIQVMDDTRDGYWEHAIIEVTWPPAAREELVESYSVKLTSMKQSRCGSSPKSLNKISKHNRYALFNASDPAGAPLSECSYTIKVSSNAADGSIDPEPATPISLYVETKNNKVPPEIEVPLEFSCTRTEQTFLSGMSFHYTVKWSVSGNPALFRNLEKFELHTGDYQYDVSGELQLVYPEFDKDFDFSYSKSSYEFSFSIYSNDDPSVVYYIELHSVKVDPSDTRPVPKDYICIENILPNAPDPVTTFQHINLAYVANNDTLLVDIEWEKPTVTYGSVLYDIYVGTQPINPNWPLDPLVPAAPSHALVVISGETYTFVYKLVKTLAPVSKGDKVVVQILTKNNHHLRSNWSAPQSAVITGEDDKVTTTPALQLDESPVPSSLIPLLGIIPVVFVVFVAVVIVAILLLVATIQNRRMSTSVGNKKLLKYPLSLSHNFSFLDSQWELSQPDIITQATIGRGTFADIHKGTLNSAVSPACAVTKKEAQGPKDVLIKSLRIGSDDFERDDFLHQLDQCMQVSVADHPFILTMYGCVTNTMPVCIVMEFPEYGNLLTYLVSKRTELEDADRGYASLRVEQKASQNDPAGVYSHLEPKDEPLTSSDMVSFCLQIASAMDCLAGLGVVHRDLACRNIYISANKTLKVTDFGIVESEPRHNIYPMELPKRWMALESLIDQVYSTATDTWSFGVTAWEIVTLGSFPYKEIDDDDLLSFLMSGQRLPWPSNCSHQIYSILANCWQKNPNSRPTFELLHETLLNLHSKEDCNQLVKVALQKPVQTSYRIKEELVDPPSLSVTPNSDSAISECHGPPSCSPDPLPPVTVMQAVSSINPGYRKESLPDSGRESEEPEVVLKVAKVTNGQFRQSGSSFVLSLDAPKHSLSSASPTLTFVNPVFRKNSEISVDDAKILAEMAPDGSSEV